jgi:plasmid stabilization system protein ParE
VARILFAPRAIADARDILALLDEKAGRQVADDHVAQFSATFDRLAMFPRSGGRRPGLGATVRIAMVHPSS